MIVEELRELKTLPDDDNIRFKEIIKKKLYQNPDIIHAIHNVELDEQVPDEYVGVSILPYLIVPRTQDIPRTYVCYTSNYDEVQRYNQLIKDAEVKFVILSDYRDSIDKETGIARHDLLGALIKREFNHTNYLGQQMVCISDTESTTDTDYAMRTLIFNLETTNNILKDSMVVNNRVVR